MEDPLVHRIGEKIRMISVEFSIGVMYEREQFRRDNVRRRNLALISRIKHYTMNCSTRFKSASETSTESDGVTCT